MANQSINKLVLAACIVLAATNASAANPYTLNGETRLVTPLGTYVCDLELIVVKDEGSSTSDNLYSITVTGGSTSGAFPCGIITLENLPWGDIDNTELASGGATIDFDNIGASAPFNLLDCDGDITVSFYNDSTASRADLEGASFGGCTFTSNIANQNFLYADPNNNITIP